MSTITVTTLSDGSVSVPTNTVVNGSAKAWVNFNGTGTIAARDSFNVASLTDNGAGDYTVSFSNAMANVNFAYLVTKSNVAVNTATAQTDIFASRTVSSARTAIIENSTFTDSANINCGLSGDLA